jgi:hypothetical protein
LWSENSFNQTWLTFFISYHVIHTWSIFIFFLYNTLIVVFVFLFLIKTTVSLFIRFNILSFSSKKWSSHIRKGLVKCMNGFYRLTERVSM